MGDGPVAAIGRHCVLELYGCSEAVLNDHELIRNALREAAEAAGATFLGEVSHQFTPQGVTALALLAESHISIHTWPETGYAAADVFTCGDHTMPQRACEHLANALKPRSYEIQQFARGRSPAPATVTAPATVSVGMSDDGGESLESDEASLLSFPVIG